jgi:electron transfer flavoprotein beta subunit
VKKGGWKIVVTAAPVHDCREPVDLDPVRKQVALASLRWTLNPPDMIALEQALRLRDRIAAARIRVVSIAPPAAESVLRECLAVGADEVERVWGEGVEMADPHGLASILAAAVRRMPFDLILAGWRRADVEHAQTGPILAELLGLPQVTCARDVGSGPDGNSPRVERRIPGRLLTVSCPLPALVVIDKGPLLRYPRYPDRRSASKAAIRSVDLGMIGIKEAPRPLIRLERVTPPKPGRRSSLGAVTGIPVVARLQRILSGGLQSKKEGNLHPCPDRESALQVVKRLLDEKLVVLP